MANSSKLGSITFCRDCRCDNCFVYNLYKEKDVVHTDAIHALRDLISEEMLSHRGVETCIDCRKMTTIIFNGNPRRIFEHI